MQLQISKSVEKYEFHERATKVQEPGDAQNPSLLGMRAEEEEEEEEQSWIANVPFLVYT